MTNKLQGTRANCTTIFLLPGIGLYKKDIEKHGFLSAYIDDKNHYIHHENSVYVLYKPEQIEAFQRFIASERGRTNLLVEDYDYEGGYVVMVYNFPEEFLKEFEFFLKGKYSKFSDRYKSMFPTSIQRIDEKGNPEWYVTLQYCIFNRTNAIKDYWEEKIGTILTDEMECWSSPNIEENETLDINNI